MVKWRLGRADKQNMPYADFRSSLCRVAVWGFLGMALIATQPGCLLVAAAAGTGAGVAYYRGDLETTLPAKPDRVATATKAAMEDMKLAVLSSESTGVDGKVVARTAGDDKVTVTIKASGESASTISIRVNWFGDSDLQHTIATKIQQKLDEMAKADGASGSPSGAIAAGPTTEPSTRASEAAAR
jgi:hypothetical protein